MQEYWFYYGLGVIARVIAGVLCGLVPLVYGAAKGQSMQGLMAFSTCIISSFFCGIFLAPIVALFYIWKIHKSRDSEVKDDEEGDGLVSLNLNSRDDGKEIGKEM